MRHKAVIAVIFFKTWWEVFLKESHKKIGFCGGGRVEKIIIKSGELNGGETRRSGCCFIFKSQAVLKITPRERKVAGNREYKYKTP